MLPFAKASRRTRWVARRLLPWWNPRNTVMDWLARTPRTNSPEVGLSTTQDFRPTSETNAPLYSALNWTPKRASPSTICFYLKSGRDYLVLLDRSERRVNPHKRRPEQCRRFGEIRVRISAPRS